MAYILTSLFDLNYFFSAVLPRLCLCPVTESVSTRVMCLRVSMPLCFTVSMEKGVRGVC